MLFESVAWHDQLLKYYEYTVTLLAVILTSLGKFKSQPERVTMMAFLRSSRWRSIHFTQFFLLSITGTWALFEEIIFQTHTRAFLQCASLVYFRCFLLLQALCRQENWLQLGCQEWDCSPRRGAGDAHKHIILVEE